MRHYLHNVLRNKEVLLIMDNTEDPLESDGDNFKQELGDILENCKNVSMLMTSRKHINKLAHT